MNTEPIGVVKDGFSGTAQVLNLSNRDIESYVFPEKFVHDNVDTENNNKILSLNDINNGTNFAFPTDKNNNIIKEYQTFVIPVTKGMLRKQEEIQNVGWCAIKDGDSYVYNDAIYEIAFDLPNGQTIESATNI
jgi:hypothetical protein